MMIGRDLLDILQRNPRFLEMPVFLIVAEGSDDGYLTSVEADQFEVYGPELLTLVADEEMT